MIKMVSEADKSLLQTNPARDLDSEIMYATNQSGAVPRRRFLKYAAGVALAVAAASAGLYLTRETKPPVTPTTTTDITKTDTSVTLSPLASYAGSLGLSKPVIGKLGEKLGDKLTDNSKGFVNYLFGLGKAEVVSPEVLQFAPETYRPSVVDSLQLKTVDDVVEENKVPDQTLTGLGYLLSFPGSTQRWYIEQHGLDVSAIDLLTRAKALGNQDFAKYAVNSLLFIQRHNPLTTAEAEVLENPSKYSEVRDSRLDEMESRGNLHADVAVELRKVIKSTELNKMVESLDVVDDIDSLILQGKPYEKFEDRFDPAKITREREVHEAFELMLKGGTPNPSDFKYSVPKWNTQLQVLCWLAEQNEFKKNDTLALACAMDNGLWVTMGDYQVAGHGQAVYRDSNGMLNFGRDTAEVQKALGFPYNLEDYGLLEKTLWAWRADNALRGGYGPHNQSGSEAPYNIFEYKNSRLPLHAYLWNNVSIETLKKAQKEMSMRGWVDKNICMTVDNLEKHFFPVLDNPNWVYTASPEFRDKVISVDGETITPYVLHNANFLFEHFLKTGKGFGVCDDQATLVSTLLKSWGVSTNFVYKIWQGTPFGGQGHSFNIFYDPTSNSWKGSEIQLLSRDPTKDFSSPIDFYIFRPPIYQSNYVNVKPEHLNGILMGVKYYSIDDIPNSEVYESFLHGVRSSEIKKWIL